MSGESPSIRRGWAITTPHQFVAADPGHLITRRTEFSAPTPSSSTSWATPTSSGTRTERVAPEGVAPTLIDDIGNRPGAYYVNIHTAPFPGGAIRGNLEREEAGT